MFGGTFTSGFENSIGFSLASSAVGLLFGLAGTLVGLLGAFRLDGIVDLAKTVDLTDMGIVVGLADFPVALGTVVNFRCSAGFGAVFDFGVGVGACRSGFRACLDGIKICSTSDPFVVKESSEEEP
jgi:hypothetical protein